MGKPDFRSALHACANGTLVCTDFCSLARTWHWSVTFLQLLYCLAEQGRLFSLYVGLVRYGFRCLFGLASHQVARTQYPIVALNRAYPFVTDSHDGAIRLLLAKLSGQRKRFGTLGQQALISKELSSGH